MTRLRSDLRGRDARAVSCALSRVRSRNAYTILVARLIRLDPLRIHVRRNYRSGRQWHPACCYGGLIVDQLGGVRGWQPEGRQIYPDGRSIQMGAPPREDEEKMRTFVSGLCAFVLLSGLVAGCTDSNQGGVSDNPKRDRMPPSASPPTSTTPDTGRTPGGMPGGSSSPSSTPTPSTPSR